MSPLSGLLGNLFHRGALLALGTLLWAAFSVGFGLSRSYAQVSCGARASCQALQPPAVMNTCRHSPVPDCLAQAVSLAACTGVGMALVSPNAQSLIADLYPAAARGRSFGATLMVVWTPVARCKCSHRSCACLYTGAYCLERIRRGCMSVPCHATRLCA